jgi:glycosyltransferase involved in cell wall biosynthesis
MQVLSEARRLWKAAPVPGPLRRALATPLYATSLMAGRLRRRANLPSHMEPGPVVVSGFYGSVLGIGRGASATASGLEAAGLPVVRHDIRPVIDSEPYSLTRLPATGGVWIQHCNAPENDLLFSHLSPAEAAGRYRIAYWAWELETIPINWRLTARAFHEIWTPSRFVAQAVRPHARRVRVMPHPIRPAPAAAADRPRFGLPTGAVVFAAFADARSALARKNPAGAILAYRDAFPEEDGRSFLSIKVVAPEADPDGMKALRDTAGGRSDIRIWTERLSEAELAAYLASVDVVVSLHRSEGFGLVLAEAYLAGKPAIATAWSGNLDFVQPASREDLTPATLTPVMDPSGRYRGGRWAEPDLAVASARMRRLAEQQALRTPPPEVAEGVERALHAPWTAEALAGEPWMRFVRDAGTAAGPSAP